MLQIQSIGHLGKDAILSNKNGKSVINFSVAHTEIFKKTDGTKVEQTTWINCAIWERENLVQYLKKGTMVFIQGSVRLSIYKDKTGANVVDLSCLVQSIELLKKPKEDNENNNDGEINKPNQYKDDFKDEDVLF